MLGLLLFNLVRSFADMSSYATDITIVLSEHLVLEDMWIEVVSNCLHNVIDEVRVYRLKDCTKQIVVLFYKANLLIMLDKFKYTALSI